MAAAESPGDTDQSREGDLTEKQCHDLTRRYGLHWNEAQTEASSGLLTADEPVALTVYLDQGPWPRHVTITFGWETPTNDAQAERALTQLEGFLAEIGVA